MTSSFWWGVASVTADVNPASRKFLMELGIEEFGYWDRKFEVARGWVDSVDLVSRWQVRLERAKRNGREGSPSLQFATP